MLIYIYKYRILLLMLNGCYVFYGMVNMVLC